MLKTATELTKKYKKSAAALIVTGVVATSLVIEPQLALFAAEAFDLLAEVARGIAAAGTELSTALPAE